MSVQYILSQAGNKIGLDPSVDTQRGTLLRLLNEAADEVYPQIEAEDIHPEEVFRINGDQTISLPTYIFTVMGIREWNSQIPWHINKQRPRYNIANWPDMWRNMRIKGRRSLQRSIVNQSKLVFNVKCLEDPFVQITINGKNDNSSSVVETVTMTSTSVMTINDFNEVTSITKQYRNTYDIIVNDVDGNLLTTLPNNELSCSYQVLDVSSLPWLNITQSNQDHYLEIQYKKKLTYLSNDADEFPAVGYDNAIVNKMCQLWFEEQGKPELALAFDSKATRTIARKHEDETQSTEDKVAFVPNPHDSLLVKIRSNKPGRYRGYTYPYGLR